jgi:hypothetical protein
MTKAEKAVIEAAKREWAGRFANKGCKCTWCNGVRSVARLLRERRK